MKRYLLLPILAVAMPLLADPSPSKPSKSSKNTSEINEGPQTNGPPVAAVSSISPEDLQGFEHYAPQIQALIRKSLHLTGQNLTYTFGSADPKKGGMDCSGTIYFVLHDFGFKDVPRQSNLMAEWVRDKTLLHRVEKADSLSHPEFSSLQPGYLLFWSGTYAAGERRTPVTHVMLYLGRLKKNGRHVVFGASDGRAYQGKRRTGVSVFDFSLPKSTSTARFYGYGMIPGVGKIPPPKPVPEVVAATKKAEDKGTAASSTSAPAEPASPKEVAPAAGKDAQAAKQVVTPPADSKEEIRPAIVLEQDKQKAQTAPAATRETEKNVSKADSPPKPKVQTTAARPKTSPSKSSSKPASVTRRKSPPPPPPPSPLDRAKRAATSFLDDVKRALPQGR